MSGNLPSTVEELAPNDGAGWTFEAFSDGKYRAVQRLTPSKELEQIFRKLFDLTGLETEYKLYLS